MAPRYSVTNIAIFAAEIDAKRHISVIIRTKVTYCSLLARICRPARAPQRCTSHTPQGAQMSPARARHLIAPAMRAAAQRIAGARPCGSAFVSARPYNATARRRASTAGRAPAPAVRGTARAKVAELVDALDLGSSGVTLESSSLSFRTTRGLLRSRTRAVRA